MKTADPETQPRTVCKLVNNYLGNSYMQVVLLCSRIGKKCRVRMDGLRHPKRWKGTFRVSLNTSKEEIRMGGRLLRLEVGASYDIFCLHGAGSQ